MSLSKHAYERKLHSSFLLKAYHNGNHQFTKYMYMYNTQEQVRTLKEGVAHTMLNFPIGVAWKIGEVKLFSYVEKTLKTYVFVAYF